MMGSYADGNKFKEFQKKVGHSWPANIGFLNKTLSYIVSKPSFVDEGIY
jgi:hypothetical protein